MQWLWLAALGYLMGALPTGYLVGRLWGVDVRRHGSGNIGATNVLRTVGKLPALVTVLGDLLKGAVPVWVAYWLGMSAFSQAWAGAWAVVGHTWPFTLGFRGGKGVATGFAVLLALQPATAGICALAFALSVGITRFVSLGSIFAAVLAPAVLWQLRAPFGVTAMFALLAAPVLCRHRSNIGRLLRGTEHKLGQRVS